LSKQHKEYRKLQEFIAGSFGIVLPKQYILNIGAEAGDLMKLEQDDGRIIIQKAEVL